MSAWKLWFKFSSQLRLSRAASAPGPRPSAGPRHQRFDGERPCRSLLRGHSEEGPLGFEWLSRLRPISWHEAFQALQIKQRFFIKGSDKISKDSLLVDRVTFGLVLGWADAQERFAPVCSTMTETPQKTRQVHRAREFSSRLLQVAQSFKALEAAITTSRRSPVHTMMDCTRVGILKQDG